jgi:hypothetical protein
MIVEVKKVIRVTCEYTWETQFPMSEREHSCKHDDIGDPDGHPIATLNSKLFETIHQKLDAIR